MKLLKTANGVYWVPGVKKSCIYDLNADKLYWISIDLYNTVDDYAQRGDFESVETLLFSLGIPCEKNSIGVESFTPPPYVCDILLLEISQRCNMSCEFCYAPSSQKDMDFDAFSEQWAKLRELSPRSIRIVGGEPLLRMDFLKKLIVFLRHEFSGEILVYTNGILLSGEICRFFADNKVGVSIAIKPFREQVAEKGLILCRENNVSVETLFLKDANSKPPSSVSPTRTDVVRLAGKATLDLYNFQLFKEKAISKATFQCSGLTKWFKVSTSIHNCFGKKILVDPEFYVFPCPMERSVKIGHLDEHDILGKIVNFGARFTKDRVESCKSCEFRYACRDCRADRPNNDVYGKPWYCLYVPEKGIWESPEEKFDALRCTFK